MRGELLNYELKRARKGFVVHGFSNMVTLLRANRPPQYSFISFSKHFLVTVGKKLPEGLGDATPSALVIMEIPTGYVVQCMYVMEPRKLYHLWTADTLPEWVASTIRNVNGHSQASEAPVRNGTRSPSRSTH